MSYARGNAFREAGRGLMGIGGLVADVRRDDDYAKRLEKERARQAGLDARQAERDARDAEWDDLRRREWFLERGGDMGPRPGPDISIPEPELPEWDPVTDTPLGLAADRREVPPIAEGSKLGMAADRWAGEGYRPPEPRPGWSDGRSPATGNWAVEGTDDWLGYGVEPRAQIRAPGEISGFRDPLPGGSEARRTVGGLEHVEDPLMVPEPSIEGEPPDFDPLGGAMADPDFGRFRAVGDMGYVEDPRFTRHKEQEAERERVDAIGRAIEGATGGEAGSGVDRYRAGEAGVPDRVLYPEPEEPGKWGPQDYLDAGYVPPGSSPVGGRPQDAPTWNQAMDHVKDLYTTYDKNGYATGYSKTPEELEAMAAALVRGEGLPGRESPTTGTPFSEFSAGYAGLSSLDRLPEPRRTPGGPGPARRWRPIPEPGHDPVAEPAPPAPAGNRSPPSRAKEPFGTPGTPVTPTPPKPGPRVTWQARADQLRRQGLDQDAIIAKLKEEGLIR